jgi:tRNA dimethylallyltransferase
MTVTDPLVPRCVSTERTADRVAMPVICLVGPTASGKTKAALALSAQTSVEIISMDSALVYRGMDIGTAKPGAHDRAQAPHHLIDIIEPTATYSAAQFCHDAHQLIAEIHGRGATPIIVGGTLLYYKALTEGLAVLPAADPSVRALLEQEARCQGWPALHARLARYDPPLARRISPNDGQRIQRALEVWTLTGCPLSEWLAAHSTRKHLQTGTPYRFIPLTLIPFNRIALHARIAARLTAMLDAGFLMEVTRLRARGNLHANLPSMRCVGYRQAWTYLEGKIDFSTLCDQILFATRQLAKRQLTWLRRLNAPHIIDCGALNAEEQVVATAIRLWNQTL